MKNIECFFSSFFFLINAILAYNNAYHHYSFAFIFLVITSLFHHYHSTELTRNIDRIAILLVSYYTIMIYLSKKNKINLMTNIYFGIFLLSIFYLFVYGYFFKKYSYDNDHRKACLWHSLLHLISCISLSILILIKDNEK
jgi:hypothetical protein